MKAEVCWDYSVEVGRDRVTVNRNFCSGYELIEDSSAALEDCHGVAITAGYGGGPRSMLLACPGLLFAERQAWSPYPMFVCIEGRRRVVLSTRFERAGCALLRPGTVYSARFADGYWRVTVNSYYGLAAGRQKIAADMESAAKKLAALLVDCYERIACHTTRIAIGFSGGVDSSLLALLASRYCGQEVRLYTVTDEKGRGAWFAEESASLLGLPLRKVVVGEDYARELLVKLASTSGLYAPRSTMDAALMIGFAAIAHAAKQEGYRYVIVGQLVDELFAGYKKYEHAAGSPLGIELLTLSDLRASSWGLSRDALSFVSSKIIPLFPYTCRELVSFSLLLNQELKLADNIRKHVFRKAAVHLGLPEQIAFRPKKAFQYSSGLEKLARKLAQRN